MNGMRWRLVAWVLIALALLVGGQAVGDRYNLIGRNVAGLMVMENLFVGVGGAERGGLLPFDFVRAMDGRFLSSGQEIQAEVRARPVGTSFHYLVYRRGALLEHDVTSRLFTLHDFRRFLVEGFMPGVLALGLGALVLYLQPGTPRSRLFLAFCLCWYFTNVTYADAHTTYRFTRLFLTAWALSPAVFIHVAVTFPQRRTLIRRFPWLLGLPYVVSAVVAVLLQVPMHPLQYVLVPGVGAAYWGLALIVLVLTFLRTSFTGVNPLVRQRARVLAAGLAVGYVPGVIGTAIEAVFRVPVSGLNDIWKLSFVFPVSVAYAMVRYNLFDLRSALRIGTIYSVVTGLVVAAYAGAIAVLDLLFASLQPASSPLVPAAVLAVGVVAFLNPVYLRTQTVVDRYFFRERYDLQQTIEQVSETMTTLLDLRRIVSLIEETVERLHPVSQTLLLYDEAGQAYVVPAAEDETPRRMAADAPLVTCLRQLRAPFSREQLEEDPRFATAREACLAAMDALGAELVVPVMFEERLTGVLALGPKRSGAAYTGQDVRLIRLLVNQSAVGLENAKAYAALQAAHAELQVALRRVEILESIRSNLSKFVPRTVQVLIEQAPLAPELAKRDADVSVLFVDIVGYTRLSERLDPERITYLIERYFGSFLDEILKRGGDVNETAGDGLMVIFQDPDRRRHARAAVKTALGILRRTQEINAKLTDLAEPIAVHIGVNTGSATVGATKIEGMAGTRWAYTATGPVTNLAARLAALGEGDAVILGPETRARLGDSEFVVMDLGEQRFRNVEHPVRVYRVAAPDLVPAA
jgi:class 3 adenylate cyclase